MDWVRPCILLFCNNLNMCAMHVTCGRMALSKAQTIGVGLLLALLAYTPLLYHLDQDTVRLWDESRVAMNAVEMAESGELITTTFEGKPDQWHTKPPMMVWLVSLSMKAFGYTTLALRLPSALASLAMVYMLFWFSVKVLGDWRTGLFAALALLSIRGFVDGHVARTGDVDALLLCFLTFMWLSWFAFLYGPEEKRRKYIWLSALGLSLAFMTKSSAAFLALPGLGIWLVVEGRLMVLLRDWRFYAAYALAIVPPAAYFLAREAADPGYLAAIWENEFWGRFGKSLEANSGPFGYYFEHLFRDHLFPFAYLLPFCFLLLLRKWASPQARIALASLVILVPFLLVISLAGTKLRWYDAQVFPLAALVLGLATSEVWTLVKGLIAPRNAWLSAGAMALMCLAIFGQNYYFIYRRNTSLEKDAYEPEAYGYAIQDLRKEKPDYPPYKIAAVDYNATAQFYALKWKLEYGETLPIHNPLTIPADTQDVILICNPYVTDSLVRIWELDTLWQAHYGCQLIRLNPLPPDSVDRKNLPVLKRRVFGLPGC